MTETIERIMIDGIGGMIGAAVGLIFAIGGDFDEGEILGTALAFGLVGVGFAENMQLPSVPLQSYNIKMN